MASSIGKKGDPERLNKIGFTAYLNKPLKKNQLYNSIGEILSRDRTNNKDKKKAEKKEISPDKTQYEQLNILLALSVEMFFSNNQE